jgi:hypothetical protein
MKPKISYLLGFSDDCYDTTGWSEVELGLPCTLTVEDDDVFKLEGTCDNAADEYAFYRKDITNISTNNYPTCIVRWKTSAASAGLQAKIRFDYTVGTKTEVLGFSTDWTTTYITLDADKILNWIYIYADDDPNTVDSGTYQVYFDFILIGNVFEFPYVSKGGLGGGCTVHIDKDYGKLDPLNFDGTIHAEGGLKAAQIILDGDMDTRTTWLTSPTGRAIYYVLKGNSETQIDVFQYFDSDLIKCKVVPTSFDIAQVSGSGKQRLWTLTLEQYSRSSGKASSWSGLEWLGF